MSRFAVSHQSEVVVLQRVKANVSSPNSFSTVAENQYTGLILQSRTRPRITFRSQSDTLSIDTDARPAPEGKLDTLDGTPGYNTMGPILTV